MLGNLQAPWLVCAAVVLLIVAVARCGRLTRADGLCFATVVGCSLIGRLLAGVWGPMHVNGQGPFWIRGAIDPEVLAAYGPGYFELLHWVSGLSSPPDHAIYLANVLLSSLSPGLLFAAARVVGVASGGAGAAALVLTLDAVSIRAAASEAYFTPIIALTASTYLSLALALSARLRRDRLALFCAVGAACFFAVAATRIHAVAYLPIALSPLILVAPARRGDWTTAILLGSASAAAIAAAILLTSGSIVLTGMQAAAKAGYSASAIHLNYGAIGALLITAVVFCWWAQPPWLPLLALAAVVARHLSHAPTTSINPFWELFYDRLFAPAFLIGAAALLPRRLQGPFAVSASVAVVAAALLLASWPALESPTTEQLEYRFLRQVLREMPDGCTLAAVARAERRVWDIPSYLLPDDSRTSIALSIKQPTDLRTATLPNDCLVYVRGSLCASVEARNLCDAVERETNLEPVARRTFPAAPSYIGLDYDRSQVEVAVFRVHGFTVDRDRSPDERTSGSDDGAPITPDFAQSLYQRLSSGPEADDCRLTRFDSARFHISVGLLEPSGRQDNMTIASKPNVASTPGASADVWTLNAPPDVEAHCPSTIKRIRESLSAAAPPAPRLQNEAATTPPPSTAWGIAALTAALLLFFADARRVK